MDTTFYHVAILRENYDTLSEAKAELSAWAKRHDIPYTINGTIDVCRSTGKFIDVDESIHFAIDYEGYVEYFND